MFAVLAEDRSDADVLVELVKLIRDDMRCRIVKKGFGGCGELCRKAASHIEKFEREGATHFIICHDSDGNDPAGIRTKVKLALLPKIDLNKYKQVLAVPVQEIEAWLIADEAAIAKAIKTLTIKAVDQPENLNDPKEWLVRESRRDRSRPLYDPPTFNEKIAKHLDIAKVERKCPSFAELTTFVRDYA